MHLKDMLSVLQIGYILIKCTVMFAQLRSLPVARQFSSFVYVLIVYYVIKLPELCNNPL